VRQFPGFHPKGACVGAFEGQNFLLTKTEKTKITRATHRLFGGVVLTILGVTLSLAIIASAVVLCLSLGGVVVLPAFAVIAMLIATSTLLLASIGCLIKIGLKFDAYPYNENGYFTGTILVVRKAFFWISICALVGTLGIISPAICGIIFLLDTCICLDDYLNVIDGMRIKKLIKKMNSDLLWKNPDAYVIACLSLASGLDWTDILNLRWDQVDLGEGIITFRNPPVIVARPGFEPGQKEVKMNCDLKILLEQYRKISKNEDLVLGDKSHFSRNYYEFIKWMRNHGFDKRVCLNTSRVIDGVIYGEIANFSRIELPEENDTQKELDMEDFFYNMDHTPLAQDLPAYIILCCIVRYGLSKDEIANLKWDMFGAETVTIPNGSDAPKIIDVKFFDLSMLQKYWPRKESDRLFEKCELEMGFRAASKFMKLNGYTAESKIEIERYRYGSYPCESVEGIEEKVQLDLSFLGPNSS
jgi:integrase